MARVKTYGQLVTSIINPSHVVKIQHREKYTDVEGNSMMPDFSEEMSVRQMIDIAEFLQARYTSIDDCDVLDERAGVHETVARNQELEVLSKAIQLLPDRCRQIFILKKVYGMSQRDIAKKLNISA